MAAVRYVVLDFDGTCTRIDRAEAGYLAGYLAEIRSANAGAPSAEIWQQALEDVRAGSPTAGWTLSGGPAAPANADPYILAGEAAQLSKRRYAAHGQSLTLPSTAFGNAYRNHPAPWRDEVAEVLQALVARELHVSFISNSDTEKVAARLDALLAGRPALRHQLHVHGNAQKYVIQEVPFARPPSPHAAHFDQLAVTHTAASAELGRPVYLRRGLYFDAICAMWRARGEPDFPIEQTLFCGDIWELDLALPQALGAPVHLIRRAPPYPTYPYELARLTDPGHHSDDLHGLLARL
jgi:phosphoglycolate phosphatase-like HAD superfamily hydrolase